MSSEIAVVEQALYHAMIAQDFAALDAILADDVVYIHSTAVAETKDGYIAGVRAGLYEYRSIESDEVTVRHYGDVAVQTGKVRMLVGARDQPKELINLLSTLLWKCEPDGWRLWQRHATRIS
jgi:ketosteroid isomerase-like protein